MTKILPREHKARSINVYVRENYKTAKQVDRRKGITPLIARIDRGDTLKCCGIPNTKCYSVIYECRPPH